MFNLVKPQAIIFDTDNTLYSYDKANDIAIKSCADKLCGLLSIDHKEFYVFFNRARKMVKKQLNNTASSHSRLLYFQRTLELLGLGTQILMVLDLEQTYWRTFLSNCRLFDDVKELILDIKKENVLVANITDLTAQIQFRKLVYFGLDNYFDFVVTSEESGYDKPHLASFEMMIEKLKISPKYIWFIGDNFKCDIESSDKLGMTTFHKIVNLKNGVKKNSATNFEFSKYADIKQIFKKCIKN